MSVGCDTPYYSWFRFLSVAFALIVTRDIWHLFASLWFIDLDLYVDLLWLRLFLFTLISFRINFMSFCSRVCLECQWATRLLLLKFTLFLIWSICWRLLFSTSFFPLHSQEQVRHSWKDEIWFLRAFCQSSSLTLNYLLIQTYLCYASCFDFYYLPFF